MKIYPGIRKSYLPLLAGASALLALSGCGFFDEPRPGKTVSGQRYVPVYNRGMQNKKQTDVQSYEKLKYSPSTIKPSGPSAATPFDSYDDKGNTRPAGGAPAPDASKEQGLLDGWLGNKSAASTSKGPRKPLASNPDNIQNVAPSSPIIATPIIPDGSAASVGGRKPASAENPPVGPFADPVASVPPAGGNPMISRSTASSESSLSGTPIIALKPMAEISNAPAAAAPYAPATQPTPLLGKKPMAVVAAPDVPPAVTAAEPVAEEEYYTPAAQPPVAVSGPERELAQEQPQPVMPTPPQKAKDRPGFFDRIFGGKDEEPTPEDIAAANAPYPSLASVPQKSSRFEQIKSENSANLAGIQQDRVEAAEQKQIVDSEPSELADSYKPAASAATPLIVPQGSALPAPSIAGGDAAPVATTVTTTTVTQSAPAISYSSAASEPAASPQVVTGGSSFDAILAAQMSKQGKPLREPVSNP